MLIRLLCAVAGLFLTLEAAHAQDLTTLMAQCAPSVHPRTLSAIVRTESSGHMYLLGDSGPRNLPWSIRKSMLRTFYPNTAQNAAEIAKSLIDSGHLVDIGLTQVSSQNLSRLGLTVEQVLDPCVNLRAGGQVLTDFYRNALRQYKDQQSALLAAISAYNTGNFDSGFSNGYVQRVLRNAGVAVPELKATALRTVSANPVDTTRRSARAYGESRRSSGLLQAKFSELDVEFH
ncbi:lytic transglycosylase domain-containing protein [Burkholderia thailandensis]|uniref:lytic transglycosylase domain-containing protein n=1 Tax=Burkholderia thailandensis TaxID=57975 RepID=UPI00217D127B|nr:lytic transglycosylase domain-containing protein [Burkholderia thailandensis]MCS6496791.1 lytic transglycosylase domain-containing protein [Burkholderia thailandensis]